MLCIWERKEKLTSQEICIPEKKSQILFAGVKNGGPREQRGPTWQVKYLDFAIEMAQLPLSFNFFKQHTIIYF